MEHLSFEFGHENGIIIHICQSTEIFSVSHDVFQSSYLYQWEYISYLLHNNLSLEATSVKYTWSQ